jgi:hypothetical protein
MSQRLGSRLAVLAITPMAMWIGLSQQVRASSPPSGSMLIKQMQSAMKQVKGYHLHATITLVEAGLSKGTQVMNADVATKQFMENALIRGRTTSLNGAGPTENQRIKSIVVGKRAAFRVNGGTWQCKSEQAIRQQLRQLTHVDHNGLKTAKTLGSGMIDGVHVWRVRVTQTMTVANTSVHVPLTYSIDQANHTLRSETAMMHLKVNGHTVRERIAATYSHFGETVQASLPGTCS